MVRERETHLALYGIKLHQTSLRDEDSCDNHRDCTDQADKSEIAMDKNVSLKSFALFRNQLSS
jgi:hypothetical protein